MQVFFILLSSAVSKMSSSNQFKSLFVELSEN